MSTTVTAPGVRLPRRDPQPRLGGVERRRRDRAHGRARHLAGARVDAAGDVRGDHRARGVVDRLDRGGDPTLAARRCEPVPSSASTRPVAPSSRAASYGTGAAPGSRSSCAAASPPSHPAPRAAARRRRARRRAAAARRRARRRRCCPCRRRPRSGPTGTRSAITRASPSPARSISSSDGIPCVSIAQRSVARICSASGSGSSQRGRLIAASRRRPPCPWSA